MAKYIDKATVVAEIERRIKGLKDCHADTVAGYAGEISGLERLLSFLNTLEVKEVKEEPVNEDLEDYAKKESESFAEREYEIDYIDRNALAKGYYWGVKAGAEWRQSNLWKSADGEDLPELEREVVAFTQNFPNDAGIMRVCIAHRPDPKGWGGRNILTGEVNHYTPKTYGKGGWSIPDVKIWLDCNLPFKENEV